MVTDRPAWFDAWIPATCPAGHPLGPGTVNLSWVHCDCDGVSDSGHPGHHLVYCRADGCHEHYWPPEHVGPIPDTERGGHGLPH